MFRAYASWLRFRAQGSVGRASRPPAGGTPAPLSAFLVAAIVLLSLAIPSLADTAGPITRQPAGSTVVPDRFLRRWDPVTLFFERDTGPAKGGAEDTPEKYASLSPAQPGAWTWLNARTLQFRPAVPWPALGRFDVKIGDKSTQLIRLLDPTTKTLPANGAQNLERVESLTLKFAEPLEVKALAQMLDIALTPLPGLDTSQTRHLTPRDFDIKPVERVNIGDEASYVVELHQPVPNGMRVVVDLGLAPDPGLEGTVEHIEFTTAEAFRPILLGCNTQRVPLSADGTVYDQSTALACKTEGAQEAAPAPASDDDDQTADAEPPAGDTPTNPDDTSDDNSGDAATNGTIIDAHPRKPGKVSSHDSPAVAADLAKHADPNPATPSAKRELVVQFSAVLGAVDPIAARNLVRITPAVDGVQTKVVGDQLRLTGQFKTDTLYQIALEPAPLKDRLGRDLVMPGRSAAWLYWPAEADFLQLAQGNGMVERLGPQMVPLHGRGYAEADVRIHAVDPLDRSFWPFPTQPIATNDSDRPPTTGEAVEPWKSPETIRTDEIKDQIARLGSPSVSSLMKLPLTPLGTSAHFGLDLAPSLARITGKDKPGTYLVGVRALDKPGNRSWMRIQVTDLSLTVVEADAGVRLYVTTLSDGKPVEKAHIRFDGTDPKGWHQIDAGDTAADGHLDWAGGGKEFTLRRVVVSKGDDTLVLDPQQAPDRYSVAGWYPSSGNWLSWTSNPTGRHPPPRALCHIFTERPIYRPDDPVHIKAYIRMLQDGLLKPGGQDLKTEVVITGPDNAELRYPVKPDANGSLHYLFDEKTTATGIYQARIDLDGHQCALVAFKKDAYRLPRFQVRIETPHTIPLDKPANVGMTATYYAGGPAGDRPVRWRVTQFPYAFTPAPRDGFTYATDAKYQSHVGFDSTAAIEREDKTDAEGRASLALDPTRERTAQPRRYVVEATVTGDDDKTVTNTEEVLALPAFVLALKAPRYLDQAKTIPIEALMVDGEGKPIVGRSITLRLKQRQWSSILEASDFTDGKPKYRTEVLDEKRIERSITSAADPVKLDLPITEAGVYIVELDAADALGRHQIVSVDLFAAGSNAVTWSRPPASVFKVTPDKAAYVPGETATMVLESPFQNGSALAIVETPDGKNRYDWVDVKNGFGKYTLLIDKAYMPRLPVHFALMRGRLKGEQKPGAIDLLRPETIAATAWIGVKPAKNIVTVAVTAPAQAQPGDTVDLTVKLSDDTGKPISGEVTLWLIDQAVLALAKEAPLDPLPSFIRDRGSRLAFTDTRNLPYGLLPLDEDPGGDVGEGDQQLLNKVTIRKNFQPVPYYNPALLVDASGTVTVHVALPDNLTIFRIRAKAVSGPDRFGFAVGQIQVHLPVIVEPNLPRFVRPGDKFALSGIGRITEGAGGPGQAQLKLDGLDLTGPTTAAFDWQPGKPQHFDFPVTVPSPGYKEDGTLARTSAQVTLGVERSGDHARDAFQVDLPIKPDRDPQHRHELSDLTGPNTLSLAAADGGARPGTLRREVLVSTEPALVRLAAGLNYLRQYPFGCTEQRVSLARAELGAKQFAEALGGAGDKRTQQVVEQTIEWVGTATDAHGLVAFWPGSKGDVWLTAWTVEFLVEAKKSGFAVDPTQFNGLTKALHQALRSDYADFVGGAEYVERAWALAALASAGDLDRGYAAELAREVDALSTEGVAEVRFALDSGTAVDAPLIKTLDDALWKGLVVKQRDGKDVYGGLQDGSWQTRSPQILPSETRIVAEMLRAEAAVNDPRRRLLVDALVTLGKGDGWGTTNSNAEALLALARFANGDTATPAQSVALTLPGGAQQANLAGDHPLQRYMLRDGGAVTATAANATAEHPVTVQSDLSWLPLADGSTVAPAATGFVVTRDSALVDPTGAPAKHVKLDKAGVEIKLTVGDTVEDSLEVVNPADRYHVAITIPLAAGMEPLNPSLNTAPPEATPSAEPTLAPTYVAFLDDQVQYFYDHLPKGTYAFHFRAKAAVPGRFIQPAAHAGMMYDDAVSGNGAGAAVVIAAAPGAN
jgi:alpha-2-macroglobulin